MWFIQKSQYSTRIKNIVSSWFTANNHFKNLFIRIFKM